MDLLERKTQLAALDEYAQEADAGNGRLVLLSGEAGVGKSTLLEQFELTLTNAEWFWGACDGLFTPRPLAPLHDLAGHLGGEVAELCRTGAPREQLFTALLDRVSQVDELTVCVVEDIHWADEATLDLLRFLGRRLRDSRALLVVTYRDEGLSAGDPLRVALGELATQRSTRRVSLPTLSAEAVAAFVGGTDLEPAEVFRLTGGNPFYLNEILRHGVGDLPTSARDAVLAHAAGLSDEARAVVDVAALIGSRVDPQLLDAVTHADPTVVDELLASGVLVADGQRMRFRHEIARLALEQAIGVHRRAPIHRGILDALLDAGCADDARLAFHAEGAWDSDLVLTHAPPAGRRAAELASHREAAAQYERALRFADQADARTTATLYDALARELSIIDRWDDTADACAHALELWREVGDQLRAGATLGLQSTAKWRLCDGPEAHDGVQEALTVLEPLGPSPELAWALANLASTRAEECRPEEAIALAERAQVMGEQLGLSEIVSDALNSKGWARAVLDERWEDDLIKSLDIALTDGWHVQAGRSYINAYIVYRLQLRFAEGERYYAEGMAHCDEHDVSTYGRCLQGEHAIAVGRLGHWSESARIAEKLLASPGASMINRMNPLIALGLVRAQRGEPGAWECLDEAVGYADGVAEPMYIVRARLARAEARWLERDTERAAVEVELAAASVGPCGSMLRSEVAAWRHRVGGSVRLSPDIAEPYASQIAGDAAGAAQQWDELGGPYDAALALLDADDESSLREALTRLERLGATAAAQLTRQRMRDLGVKSVPSGARATTRAHPAGLTKREREVLELIVEGDTNDEISNRLFISVKTVDHHVSAVLGKLGVGSRKVAATEAVRLGLVGAER